MLICVDSKYQKRPAKGAEPIWFPSAYERQLLRRSSARPRHGGGRGPYPRSASVELPVWLQPRPYRSRRPRRRGYPRPRGNRYSKCSHGHDVISLTSCLLKNKIIYCTPGTVAIIVPFCQRTRRIAAAISESRLGSQT